MKIKQKDIASIYSALQTLSEVSMPIQTAWNIYQVTEKIKKCFEFGLNEETKLIKKHNGVVNQDGRISFTNEEDVKRFNEEMCSILDFESEVDIDVKSINLSGMGNIKLAPHTLECLSLIFDLIN